VLWRKRRRGGGWFKRFKRFKWFSWAAYILKERKGFEGF
jgi:hypothetical protein